MKPDAWKYQVNGVHTDIEEIEPPDDAYDEGTLTPLYSAATIRKWLSEEISQQVFDAGAYCTGGWEDTYRAMIAEKLKELEQHSPAKKAYEASNPLGGPARMFDAIAERIRSGEDYYAVLADYGVTVEAK